MATNTYNFWAEFFRQAAEGQARFDELRKWMEQGRRSTGGMYDTFRKWFEATTGTPVGESNQVYEELMAEFNRAIQQFLNDFGVVPKAAYRDLEEKNRAFKQRIDEQEETIRRLRRMLAEKELGLSEGSVWFSEMMKTQQEQFKRWMEMFMSHGGPQDESGKGGNEKP